MIAPSDFKTFCQQFHQDIGLIFSTTENMIASAVSSLSKEQRKIILNFLDELLSGKYDPIEIDSVWWDSGADVYFSKSEDLIAFLRQVRETLRKDQLAP